MRKVLKYHLSNFFKGWVIGNFEPSIYKNENFEIALKEYKLGEKEAEHYQLTAFELSVVVSGSCRLGEEILTKGEILLIPPLVSADFEALTDCSIIAVKWPSKKEDKVLGTYNG